MQRNSFIFLISVSYRLFQRDILEFFMNMSTQCSTVQGTDAQTCSTMNGFGLWDYIVCAGMVVASGLIGLSYSICGKQNDSADSTATYLMGGRQMTIFPIGMSLIISFFSGVGLQGLPAETYMYGSAMGYSAIWLTLIAPIGCYITLPVIHPLKITSLYEYLDKRFDRKVRLMISVFKLLQIIFKTTITVYLAVLAFKQVSGVNIHITSACISVVCTFYTIVGGFKAVVWADTVQALITFAGLMTLAIKGTMDIGGIQSVWQKSYESGRLDYPSFQEREGSSHNFWNTTIGYLVILTSAILLNQDSVQRYLALPTLRQARNAVWIFIIGILALNWCCTYIGLLIYATYHDCNPLATKEVTSPDQLLILLVTRVFGEYPGLTGLFAATVFSVCLSTFSTGLNTAALTVLEDLFRPHVSTDIGNNAAKHIMRAAVAGVAVTSFGLMFVFESTSGIFGFTMAFLGVTVGPSVAIFLGGMLLPWMNSKGVFYGGIFGFCVLAVIAIGGQSATLNGNIKYDVKPTSVSGCGFGHNVSSTTAIPNSPMKGYVFPLFKLNHLWFAPLGILITVLAAMIISYCTGLRDLNEVDPKLIAPAARRLLPKKIQEELVPMTQDVLLSASTITV